MKKYEDKGNYFEAFGKASLTLTDAERALPWFWSMQLHELWQNRRGKHNEINAIQGGLTTLRFVRLISHRARSHP